MAKCVFDLLVLVPDGVNIMDDGKVLVKNCIR